jgi:hypothetical protein
MTWHRLSDLHISSFGMKLKSRTEDTCNTSSTVVISEARKPSNRSTPLVLMPRPGFLSRLLPVGDHRRGQSPADALEYATMACEGEFDELDRAFHACRDFLHDVLTRHLEKHEDEFIAGIMRMRSREDWQGL